MSENSDRSAIRKVTVILFVLVTNGLIVATLLQSFLRGE